MDGCKIQSNPDISGIGVRAAIYIQSLLCFAPALDAIRDCHVSTKELDRVRNQSTATLIIAFAILISAVIQGLTLGLTNFHATIILSLSWMNNTNAFVFFLLYMQYKSQMDRTEIPAVKPELGAWIDHIKTVWGRYFANQQFRELGRRKTFAERGWNFLAAQSIIIIGSVHLSFMAVLGVWLWSNPGTFGDGQACAYGIADIGIVGQRVPFDSRALKIFSLVLYGLFLIPGLNLVIPAAVFMGPFLVFQNKLYEHLLNRKGKGKDIESHRGWNLKHPRSCFGRSLLYPSIIPISIGLFLLFLINVIFIFDVELVLLWNKAIQENQDESEWGFGQTLAILLLVIPLRDLQIVDWILSLWNLKKEMKRKADLNRELLDEIYLDNPGGFLKIMELVLKGANPNTRSTGKMQTALEICSLKHDFQGVGLLLERGADPSIRFSSTGDTFLDTTIKKNKSDLSFALLFRGSQTRYLDFEVFPLHAVIRMGSLDFVKYLLDTGADPNLQGGHYGTPLMTAVLSGNIDIVQRLLDNKADPNLEVEDDVSDDQGRRYRTPLAAAKGGGRTAIVKLLKRRGARR